jgi:Nickel responsive protein SCO4226-like
MGCYLVERSFPEGLRISVDDEGAAVCRMIAFNNAEDGVTWIQSYVSDDRKKTYCIYDGPSPEAIDRIMDVRILNPYSYH